MASAASAGPPGGPPPPTGALIRTPSDPSQVLPQSSTLLNIVRRATTAEGGADYFVVRLTAAGNGALRELCRTPEQREVWSWPSYEFLVKMKKDRTPVISADQVCFHFISHLFLLLTLSLDRSVVRARRT